MGNIVKKISSIIIPSILLGLSTTIGLKAPEHILSNNQPPPIETQITNQLPLDKKINQMIIVPIDYAIKNNQDNYGGAIYLHWHITEINTSEKIKTANQSISNNSIKPLIAIDEEGGIVRRLCSMENFESIIDSKLITEFIKQYYEAPLKNNHDEIILPGEQNITNAYQALNSDEQKEFIKKFQNYSKNIAQTLSALGFTINLAPIIDIIPEENDKYILARQERTFGQDKEIVTLLADTYIKGFQEYNQDNISNILTCGKHFPGLGSAKPDPHQEQTIINKTLDELFKEDIYPYEALLESIPTIMLSQAIYLAVDDIPATVSPKIRNLLKEKMQYQGIIISDDITMEALDIYEQNGGDRWINAAKTNDMILTVESETYYQDKTINWRGTGEKADIIGKIKDGIKNALTENEINERVETIIQTKLKFNLINTNAYEIIEPWNYTWKDLITYVQSK